MEMIQRKIALMVANAYKTTSVKAKQVINEKEPIHFQVSETASLHGRKNSWEVRRFDREASLSKWQQE